MQEGRRDRCYVWELAQALQQAQAKASGHASTRRDRLPSQAVPSGFADLVGSVTVSDVKGPRGRSLVTSRHVKAGELLLACRALAVAWPQDHAQAKRRGHASTAFTTATARADLVQHLHNSSKHDVQLRKQLADMHSGAAQLDAVPEAQTSVDAKPETILSDSFIQRVVAFNAFEPTALPRSLPDTLDMMMAPVKEEEESGEDDDTDDEPDFRHAGSTEATSDAAQAGGGGGGRRCQGSGLWVLPSLINHSCIANCSRVFVGDFLCSRALQDLPAGTELVWSYVDPLEPLQHRTLRLQHYGFRCACELCTEQRQHTPTLKQPTSHLASEATRRWHLHLFASLVERGYAYSLAGSHAEAAQHFEAAYRSLQAVPQLGHVTAEHHTLSATPPSEGSRMTGGTASAATAHSSSGGTRTSRFSADAVHDASVPHVDDGAGMPVSTIPAAAWQSSPFASVAPQANSPSTSARYTAAATHTTPAAACSVADEVDPTCMFTPAALLAAMKQAGTTTFSKNTAAAPASALAQHPITTGSLAAPLLMTATTASSMASPPQLSGLSYTAATLTLQEGAEAGLAPPASFNSPLSATAAPGGMATLAAEASAAAPPAAQAAAGSEVAAAAPQAPAQQSLVSGMAKFLQPLPSSIHRNAETTSMHQQGAQPSAQAVGVCWHTRAVECALNVASHRAQSGDAAGAHMWLNLAQQAWSLAVSEEEELWRLCYGADIDAVEGACKAVAAGSGWWEWWGKSVSNGWSPLAGLKLWGWS